MIYTSSIFCCFAGFFMLYNTSRKAALSRKGNFEKYLQHHRLFANSAGLLLIAVSFILLANALGTGVGLLTAFLLLMTIASLVIAITPLQYFRTQHFFILLAGIFFLEQLFS